MKKKEKNKQTHKDALKIEAGAVLDCLDFEIMIINKDFEIIFANQAVLEELNVSREEIEGRHCYAVTHHLDQPCQPPKDPCPIRKAIDLKNKTSIEVHTHYKKDGSKFLVNVVAAVLGDGNSDIFLHIDLPVKEKVKDDDAMRYILKKTQQVLDVIDLYQKRVDELERKTAELETFNSLAVDRELKMIELKERLKKLEEKQK